jgi:hypothetical protein
VQGRQREIPDRLPRLAPVAATRFLVAVAHDARVELLGEITEDAVGLLCRCEQFDESRGSSGRANRRNVRRDRQHPVHQTLRMAASPMRTLAKYGCAMPVTIDQKKEPAVPHQSPVLGVDAYVPSKSCVLHSFTD